MSRPRTPTAILEARGAFIAHPERRTERVNEPKPAGPLGDPPPHLTRRQKNFWRELAAELPPGVAGNCDRKLLELTVTLCDAVRSDKASSGDKSLYLQCLSKLGMTPTDRSRVQMQPEDKPGKADPFAEFRSAGQA